MITVSQHLFQDLSDSSSSSSSSSSSTLSISITEVIEEEYGLHVWPCSIALAEYVWQQRNRFSNANVLELGAGTSLPGILAAKIGSHVTLTDINDKPEVFRNMRINCDQNGVNYVLYNAADFDDLFATVAFMLFKNPEAVFITSYEPRSEHRSIELLMAKWELKCTKLLDAHKILPETKSSLIPNSIEIVEIQAALCDS